MKKSLIYFSLFILHFSFCFAQDTLVLKTGQKISVKVISVVNEVVYSLPPDNKPISMNSSKVSYIKYSDGTIYHTDSFTSREEEKNSFQKKITPYLVVSWGVCQPFFSYGGSSYTTDYEEFEYSGYASGGTIYSLTAGIITLHGWEVTFMYSDYKLGFNSTGFLTENAAISLNNRILNDGSPAEVENAYTKNKYSINNSGWLIGISKNWGTPKLYYGLSMMAGQLITNLPALQGYCNMDANGLTPEVYTLNTASYQNTSFDFELGMHVTIKITHHIILRGDANIQISGSDMGTQFQFLNQDGKNMLSGSFGVTDEPTSVSVGLANATIGIGYQF
jgi:hypothetical protein